MFAPYLFPIGYWITSILFTLLAAPLLILPSRKPLMKWLRLYARTMVGVMRHLGGIDLTFKGHENLPDGPFILAPKHQSWGDGFASFSQIPDLGFVTNNRILNYPLVGPILRKIDAIVIDSCGGDAARDSVTGNGLDTARTEGRHLLIYPEGRLVPVGETERFRKGVYHMYEAYGCPVVPAATDLGVRWPQHDTFTVPGPATLEFLEPIPPGLDKETFMTRLQDAIEGRSRALLEEQRAAGTLPDGVELPPLPQPA
ncbi:lysophospholipid acyltransferase family protein [Aestuariibius insulae]|uniref:lysophospholipid acyltransferase family protein n=1 Tax=Aestuariibius insulae TaxID=2058287 RepID=UPI00345EAE40